MQIAAVAAVVTSIKSAGAYRQDMNTTDLSTPPIDLDKPDSPATVHLLVNSNKMYGLDMIGMRYTLDFYLYWSWRDDRQKSGKVRGNDLRMGNVWSPRPEIMNREGGDPMSPSCVFQLGAPAFTLLNITEGKWCLCQTRVKARLDPASTRNLGLAILMYVLICRLRWTSRSFSRASLGTHRHAGWSSSRSYGSGVWPRAICCGSRVMSHVGWSRVAQTR